MVLDDFVLMDAKFSENKILNIYPLGDVHIGSKEFNLELFKEWVEMVKNDQNGAVVIIGDMMNMGLRNSKSNVYEETLSPREQKDLCYELLKPIANKIIAGCSGNHEYRAVKEVGMNPLYDVFCRLCIEDRCRENACFIKLTVGKQGKNNNTYGVVLTHGSSKNKDEKWTYSVDGCDCFISGHTHEVTHKPLGKIKMDLSHNRVKTVGYHHIVVTPFQAYGGYAIRSKYMPNNLGQFQRITFDGTSKRIGYAYF
jgi:predicted phosphodiesterase